MMKNVLSFGFILGTSVGGKIYGMESNIFRQHNLRREDIECILDTKQGKAFIEALEKTGAWVISKKYRGPCKLCLGPRKDWVLSKNPNAIFEIVFSNTTGENNSNEQKNIKEQYTLGEIFYEAFVMNFDSYKLEKKKENWVFGFFGTYSNILEDFIKCDWKINFDNKHYFFSAENDFLYNKKDS